MSWPRKKRRGVGHRSRFGTPGFRLRHFPPSYLIDNSIHPSFPSSARTDNIAAWCFIFEEDKKKNDFSGCNQAPAHWRRCWRVSLTLVLKAYSNFSNAEQTPMVLSWILHDLLKLIEGLLHGKFCLGGKTQLVT